jgi:hypothetical protein
MLSQDSTSIPVSPRGHIGRCSPTARPHRTMLLKQLPLKVEKALKISEKGHIFLYLLGYVHVPNISLTSNVRTSVF